MNGTIPTCFETLPLSNVIGRSKDKQQANKEDKFDNDKILPTQKSTDKENQSLCQRLSAIQWRSVFTLLILVVAYFLVCAAISLIGAFFPTKALDKDASPLEIGAIIGIASLTPTIFGPIVGYFLPKLGFRFSIGIGLAIVGITYLALGPSVYLPSGWVFVIVCTMLRFTQGIGSAFFYTTAYAMVAKLYPDSIGFVIGIIELGSGLGYACGPVIGGYLYLAGGYQIPFYVMGGLCLLFTIPTVLLLKSSNEGSQLLRIRMLTKLLSDFVLFMLLLSVVLQMAGIGFMVSTLAIFYKNEFTLSPEKIGLSFLSFNIPYVLSSPISGKIADKTSPRFINICGLFLSGIGFLLVGPSSFFFTQPILWLSIVARGIMGIGAASGLVAVFPDMRATALASLQLSETSQSDSDSEDMNSLHGVIAGLIGSCISFGQFLGPIIGGGLTQFLNFQDSSTIYGELLLALMIVLMGVSLTDKCHRELFERKQKGKESFSSSKG